MLNPTRATDRPAAAETAYQHTKQRILTGELPTGMMLSEGDIAGQLGLSRTPVREAFLRLETEGWLRLYPKRGALVVPVAPGEAEAVIEARLLLESHAVEALLTRPEAARQGLAARLSAIVERQVTALDAGDLDEYAREDSQFHLELVAAGANSLLLDFYVTLRERQQRMIALSMLEDESRGRGFVAEHAALIALIESGDASGFHDALRAHLHRAHGIGEVAAR